MNLTADQQVPILLCTQLGRAMPDAKIPSFSASKYHRLMQDWKRKVGPISLILTEDDDLLFRVFQEQDANRISVMLRGHRLQNNIEQMQSSSTGVLTENDGLYPECLQKIMKDKAPPVLFYRGNIHTVNSRKKVTVVGKRDADEASLALAQIIGKYFASEKTALITGGARGVDSEATIASLNVKGNNILFLPYGFNNSQALVWEGRLGEKDVLLSSCEPSEYFSSYRALERNQMMYSLADTRIVLSANLGKGGSWSGAKWALERNLPVYVPKSNDPALTKLLDYGAYCFNTPSDIVI